MEKVEAIFSTSDRIGSRIIRFLTSGKWSHCGILKNPRVIDSNSARGVKSVPFSSWKLNRRYKVIDVTSLVDPSKKSDADKFLKETMGARYDFEYLKSALNPFREEQIYIDGEMVFRCNEHLYKYLIAYGVTSLDQEWIFRSSPESLYQILRALVEQKNAFHNDCNINGNTSLNA